MNYETAASLSKLMLAVRGIDNALEVYDIDSHSFFNYQNNTISRKPGRGSVSKDDWEPGELKLIQDKIEDWKAEQEKRPLIPLKPWQAACMASPVYLATRHDKFVDLIRDINGKTWTLNLQSKYATIVKGPFKHYDGWEPVGEDHPFATMDTRLDTITPPKVKNYTKPDAPLVAVTPETTNAVVSIAQTLERALEHANESDKTKIVAELLRLSNSVSWHLREDRQRYA